MFLKLNMFLQNKIDTHDKIGNFLFVCFKKIKWIRLALKKKSVYEYRFTSSAYFVGGSAMFQSFTTVKRKTVLSFRFVRIMSIERNKRSHESENNERSTFSNVSLCAASTLMYNCVTGYRMETLVLL